MTYFTSWDVNTFLCLIYWGLPGDVVKRMMKVTKKTHEEFSFSEALSYWTTNSPSLVRRRLTQPFEHLSVSLKFQMNSTLEFQNTRIHVFKRRLNLTKEFKQEWRQRSIEDRQTKVIEWCDFGSEQEQNRHQKRLEKNVPRVARETRTEWILRSSKRMGKYTKNLWKTWEAGAGASSYYFVGQNRRNSISKWYEGIHPGRFFLFYKVNEIIQERNGGVQRAPCEDGYRYPRTPIFDWGPYEQLIEDLKCIDGPGLGESGPNIEHIDDTFPK
tara:strand:+ start:1907 stop:2719 length:813 start_codon:yes stop_codon:yes gene_type:complete